nr:hypothetical protein [Tanacetum cinerariifolium]
MSETKRAKDAAYHREKMLLCKQEEDGIQLNTEQADWRDDTDDESEDQELESHYMYMTQIQEVSPYVADSGPIFDSEPLQKVSNDDHYNVFAIENEHLEQSKSVNDTYPIEQDEHNVIIDSLDMSYDREQIDQNDDDDDLANERELLASLIEKLKCKIDDSKNRNKFLETSNKVLVEKLKEMKKELCAHHETISILSQAKEAQIKLYKTCEDKELDKLIALENKVKVLDNIVYKTCQPVQMMNILNNKCRTSFAKPEFLKKAKQANPLVSKSFAESTAEAPNQCQQQHTTPLNTQTTTKPSCQVPTQAPTVVSTENINQAEMIAKNAQVKNDEFINIFCTPIQDRGETSSRHVDSSNMHTFYQHHPSEHRWMKDHMVDILLVQIYVDDIIFGSTNLKLLKQFEKLMHSMFEMSMMGELKFFLGIQIHQSPRGIFINQAKYAQEILIKHGMTSCDSVCTPMATKHLDADLSGTSVDQMKYRSMVGALMYLTASRPDIMHATCYCARYQVKPTEKHLTADCTLMSLAEAEYVSLSSCCAQVLWMRTQLIDYRFYFDKIPMYCDSKAAIAISCNPVQHSRTQHIDVRYHFIKEKFEKGIVELLFVRTEYQLADLFTKALPEERFKYLIKRFGMRCLTSEELEVLLTDYGFHFDKIPMYCDLNATIAISCNPVQHSRTKHIDVRYHFIKEKVKKERFKYFVRRLGMRCLTPAEMEALANESA